MYAEALYSFSAYVHNEVQEAAITVALKKKKIPTLKIQALSKVEKHLLEQERNFH